jgi:hypothetical protein
MQLLSYHFGIPRGPTVFAGRFLWSKGRSMFFFSLGCDDVIDAGLRLGRLQGKEVDTGHTVESGKPVSLQAPILPAKDDARFQPLLAMAEQNWREQNPELVSKLEQSGKLKQTLESAVELTIISLQQSEQAGLSPDQARELAYEYLLQRSPNS